MAFQKQTHTVFEERGGVLKNLTVAWLKEKSACGVGIEWFRTCGKEKPSDVMDALLSEKKLAWANWLITRLLSPKDRIRYAIFAAEQVIGIYQKRCLPHTHIRHAIKAANAVLKKDNDGTRDVARAAWDVFDSRPAWDVWDARAAWAASFAAWSAWSAEESACDAWAAREDMFVKIIRYGMGLCFGRGA